MAHQQTNNRNISDSEDVFRKNSSVIIKEMEKLSENTQERFSELVDEILHCTFFLGKISFPDFSPNYLENHIDNLNQLKSRFPNAFVHYSSQLPRRSPISCLLDMIVQVEGERNESQIIKKLQEINNALQKGSTSHFISSAICVSQEDDSPDSIRYYGVSMSTVGRIPGKIMVAASCLDGWDSHVADAVMTYYPTKSKKPFFDGTIELPESVRCQTFSLSLSTEKKEKKRKEMRPCRSCRNLFGLHTDDEQGWAYGNCAEAESLSNLLKKVEELKRVTQPKSKMWTEENRQKAKEEVRKELRRLLNEKQFPWNDEFYTPQRAFPHTKRKFHE